MDGSLKHARALIVEDHPLYRNALISLLQPAFGEAGIQAAPTAEEGLRLAAATPDLRIILLDPGLPQMNGVEAVAAFARACPGALIIAVSASDDRREVDAALRAGALAFVSKAVAPEVLSRVIADALAGRGLGRWITAEGEQVLGEAQLPGLSPRQREVLTLLCQGHSNKEIGLRLSLAEITVKMHVTQIFRALDVASRTQAVRAARRIGLYAGE
jgi:DNA-binding NarL/FixJ family response regulator